MDDISQSNEQIPNTINYNIKCKKKIKLRSIITINVIIVLKISE